MPGWAKAALLIVRSLLEQLGPTLHCLQDRLGRDLHPCPRLLQLLGFPEQARWAEVAVLFLCISDTHAFGCGEMQGVLSWLVAQQPKCMVTEGRTVEKGMGGRGVGSLFPAPASLGKQAIKGGSLIRLGGKISEEIVQSPTQVSCLPNTMASTISLPTPTPGISKGIQAGLLLW